MLNANILTKYLKKRLYALPKLNFPKIPLKYTLQMNLHINIFVKIFPYFQFLLLYLLVNILFLYLHIYKLLGAFLNRQRPLQSKINK